jgi:hypothetical protein
MKFPQVVILGFDDWLAKQLAEQAADGGWLIRDVRQPAVCRDHARENRPTVVLVQSDPHDAHAAPLNLIADIHRTTMAVAVAVSDIKLSEDERIAWTAAALDVGARYVLFPPLTRPVLEDLVGGLMATVCRRTVTEAVSNPQPAGVIDLATEGQADT